MTNQQKIDATLIEKRFDEIAENLIRSSEKITFNLKNLPEIDYNDALRKSPYFEEMFRKLDAKVYHCLYWYEADTTENATRIMNLLDDSREMLSTNKRTVPVKNKNSESKVLYVGIRRGGVRKRDKMSNLTGRTGIHLGYYEKGSTQGLQFAHWAKDTDYNITLNVVEFDKLPNDYLNTLEKILAYKLKPLCGKH